MTTNQLKCPIVLYVSFIGKADRLLICHKAGLITHKIIDILYYENTLSLFDELHLWILITVKNEIFKEREYSWPGQST